MDTVTVPPTAIPPGEVPISDRLVIGLIEDQCPQYARLPLTHLNDGWDNSVYRLGDELLVRMPRRQLAADIAVAEHDWLPRLSLTWTFPAPVPLAIGQPGRGYPWRWALVPWLPGEVAMTAPLSTAGAADLGAALAQVHVPAPDGAPYNDWRSTPLAHRAQRFDQRLELLAAQPEWVLNVAAATAVFEAADERAALTWCHLDIHGNNVLSLNGRLAGLLDWGDSGAGDPATDLGQALYMVGSKDYAMLASAYANAGGPADPSAPRVRAEALVYAVTMATLDEPHYRATGWRALADLGLALEAHRVGRNPDDGPRRESRQPESRT